MVSAPDGRDTPGTLAVLALAEEEATDAVSREFCVGGSAHLARHVLADVFPEQRLDVLGNVPKSEASVSIGECER